MTEATLSQGTDQLQEHPKAATSPGATLWIPMSFRKGRARLCTLSDQPSFSSTNHLNVKPLLTLEDHPSKKCKAVPAIAKKTPQFYRKVQPKETEAAIQLSQTALCHLSQSCGEQLGVRCGIPLHKHQTAGSSGQSHSWDPVLKPLCLRETSEKLHMQGMFHYLPLFTQTGQQWGKTAWQRELSTDPPEQKARLLPCGPFLPHLGWVKYIPMQQYAILQHHPHMELHRKPFQRGRLVFSPGSCHTLFQLCLLQL